MITEPAHELKIGTRVKEELCHHKIPSCLNLTQKVRAILLIGNGLRMRTRVAGHAYGKIRLLPMNIGHKIGSVTEGTVPRKRFVLRRISPQGQNIVHSGLTQIVHIIHQPER